MLDHRQAAGGGDKARCRRDVDRTREIAAGAAAVGKQPRWRRKRAGGCAQRLGGADQFFGAFALDPQRDEGRGHERLAEASIDDSGEEGAGQTAIEIGAIEQLADRIAGGRAEVGNGSRSARKRQNLAHENHLETKSPPATGPQ